MSINYLSRHEGELLWQLTCSVQADPRMDSSQQKSQVSSRRWWIIPLIPALWWQRRKNLFEFKSILVYRERKFQDRQVYTERPCLKTNKQTTTKWRNSKYSVVCLVDWWPQVVSVLYWNAGNVGSNTSEGVYWQAIVRVSRQRMKAFLSHVLSGRQPSEGVTQSNLRKAKLRT